MKSVLIYLIISVSAVFVQSLEEKSSAALFRDVFKFLEEQSEIDALFDIEDDDVRGGVLKLFQDYGFDESDLLEDGVISGLWNMLFSKNGKKTFQAYNLARQLGCYQGQARGFRKTINFALTKYNEYGCYCGGGQSYGTPLDATDRCCKTHDECYDAIMKKYKIAYGCDTYTTQYTTTCCKAHKNTKCNDPGPSAGRAFCDCDQAMGVCVSQPSALKSYSSSNKYARKRSSCRVPGKKTTSTLGFWGLLKSCTKVRRVRNTGATYAYKGQGQCSTKSVRSSRRRSRTWFRWR